MMPAFQRHRVRLCRTKAHEFAVFCGGCIRYQAGDILLDGGLHNNCLTESDSLCGRLLGSTPASQWYKVCLCRIKAQEFAVFCGGYIRYPAGGVLLDGRYVHSHSTDLDALCGRLLGLMPSTWWYTVRLCHMKTQEFAVFCAGCIRYHAGDILLDGRYLHNHRTDFDSFGGWLLAMTQASQ